MLKFVLHIFCLALTLSSCKKDCNGSFTIEGTLWNGTKNKPHVGVLVEAVAGKGNSLFSTGSNVKDVGAARTDENGKFKITYNCVGDDMDGISLRSSDLQYSSISAENRLPINQNYSQFYNIPDSVTIKVYIKPRQPLGLNDTAYLRIPGANEYFDNKSYYAPFYRIYSNSTITDGYFKTIRIRYKDQNYPLDNALKFRTARGYNNYLNTLSNTPEFSVILNKMEPDVNEITLYY